MMNWLLQCELLLTDLRSNRSESPVIHRTGLAMGLLNIYLGYLGIMPDHIQAAVTQERLKGKNVPARAQVGDGKGMSELVWVGIFHPGSFSNALDDMAESSRIERTIPGYSKEWCIRIFHILSFG